MGKFRDQIARTLPWLDSILEFFDWRKSVIATISMAVIAGWSFMKDIPWPIIVTTALTVLVQTMYLLHLPAFIKLIHGGVKARPNHGIWKHKKQFELYQAACLLADSEPISIPIQMDGDSRAWYELLCDAIETKEINRIQTPFDDRKIVKGQYFADERTIIDVGELKKFCSVRGRKPEFLS